MPPQERDYLNNRYFAIRALYLARLAKHLQKHEAFEEVAYELFNVGCMPAAPAIVARRPIRCLFPIPIPIPSPPPGRSRATL